MFYLQDQTAIIVSVCMQHVFLDFPVISGTDIGRRWFSSFCANYWVGNIGSKSAAGPNYSLPPPPKLLSFWVRKSIKN